MVSLKRAVALVFAFAAAINISAAYAFTMDTVNHVANVFPADGSNGLISAFTNVNNRTDKTVRWKINFAPGTYNIIKGIYINNLQNVDVVGNGAVLQKAAGSSEYILNLKYAKDVKITGFKFIGLTSYTTSNDCVWGEQGVYLGSTRNVTVDKNQFFNFGDAALRVVTVDSDPIKGINSFDNKTTNNYFRHVCQTSTTSNSFDHGGTENYLFQFNTFDDLHGSVKFATRTPAKNVKVLDNWVRSSTWHGIESDNYDNLTIQGNRLENIAQAGITVYTNGRAQISWAWGNNLLIKKNTITNVGQGIRFSPNAFADGFTFIPKNVTITENTITKALANPGISIVNGQVDGLTVTNNKLAQITSKRAINIPTGCTNVINTGNTMDGIPVK